jgi:pimeloyl-ACP methyl ester carboxylesterase
MSEQMPPSTISASGERFARVGEVELCYETYGREDAPALLLVMGLGSQMILWEEGFCAALAAQGRRVIRFDNRDVGRSTIIRCAPPPTLRQLLLRDRRAAAYSLDDMAEDAVGLLDALGIERADVVGASMGGMIAQLMAINHRERLRSLTSIMSSTGRPWVGLSDPRLLRLILRAPSRSRDRYVEDFTRTMLAIGSRTNPGDPSALRAVAGRCFDRGYHPAGTARQLAAIQTAWDRTGALRRLRLPALVIHGREDRLIHPSGGRATARAIPGARLLMLDGMGHDLPRALWRAILAAIDELAPVS